VHIVLPSPTSGWSPKRAAPGCFTTQLADLGLQKVTVGTYFSSADTTGTFTYSAGQTSTRGVAAQSGQGFKASGTKTVTATATVGFPQQIGAKNVGFQTYFDYRKYRTTCPTLMSSVVHVEPVQWAGGEALASLVQPAAGNCLPMPQGAWFVSNTERAGTLEAGADLSYIIGINLSAQTGYDRSAQLRVDFPKHGHPICGTNTDPAHAEFVTVHPGVVR
jgi:hypothetical protein